VEYPVMAIGASAPGAAVGGGNMKMHDHGGMMQMEKRGFPFVRHVRYGTKRTSRSC